ncbi:MAG: TonB family protein [Nitrospirota bacterium]
MKLLTGKRIGQSGGELAAAVLFSFFIHVIMFIAAIFLVFQGTSRVLVPPSYRVKLVDLPPDIANLPPTMTEQAAQPPAPVVKPQAKQKMKAAKAAGKPAPPRPSAVSKSALPELDSKKPETKAAEETAPAQLPAASGKKQESVAVASTTSEFQFPPYLLIVRDKVERNWNPPPGVKGARVKVMFKVLRTGRVGESKLMESSGNFYFDQAAMRAILASSPFPPLPEGFFKEYETFSVDLMEKE